MPLYRGDGGMPVSRTQPRQGNVSHWWDLGLWGAMVVVDVAVLLALPILFAL